MYPIACCDRPSIQGVVQILDGQKDNLLIPPNPFDFEGPQIRACLDSASENSLSENSFWRIAFEYNSFSEK